MSDLAPFPAGQRPPSPPPQSSPGPCLAITLPQLDRLERMLSAVLEDRPAHAWYTLEQAWRIKFGGPGGVSLQTLRNTLALQPRGGLQDGWQSGRKAWLAETVEAWSRVDDEGLAAYLAGTCPARRVPGRILAAIEKRKHDYPSLVKELA